MAIRRRFTASARRRSNEALAAKRDVWGEAAMAQPNGASYEFFAPLLPPPRYVQRRFPLLPDRAQRAERDGEGAADLQRQRR